jgi:hypothetical protein
VSLRLFHVLFIALSIALSAVVSAWGVQRFLDRGESSGLVLAVVFIVAGLSMVVYGSRYFQKLKELE